MQKGSGTFIDGPVVFVKTIVIIQAGSSMPRSLRQSLGGYCYHVFNRGNARQTVFHKPEDYDAFLKAMRHATDQVPMRLLAACLMPNHFHLVVWPEKDGDLSRWMQWLTSTHVRRYHKHHDSSGHVWQGRFKAFAIQDDDHLLTVFRYVERNPVRAGLCKRSTDWRWSSARWRKFGNEEIPLASGPVPLPNDWSKRVDTAHLEVEYEVLRRCIERNRPYGSTPWTTKTAKALGATSSLGELGRPKKANNGA
jgi:putative transposase